LDETQILFSSLKMSTDSKIVVGYWGIRGLGSSVRFLLAITGANFER
jgi:hypothetical protein